MQAAAAVDAVADAALSDLYYDVSGVAATVRSLRTSFVASLYHHRFCRVAAIRRYFITAFIYALSNSNNSLFFYFVIRARMKLEQTVRQYAVILISANTGLARPSFSDSVCPVLASGLIVSKKAEKS